MAGVGDFCITNKITSSVYREDYRKIGFVPMICEYTGGGTGNYSLDVYYDNTMFLGTNITSSGSGGGISYDQVTINGEPAYTKFAQKYATLNQTTNKYTNFSNSVIINSAGSYYGVPLVYISQTDGWKPVEMMPYLWRDMEPFYFENIGDSDITITITTPSLSEYVLKSMNIGNFVPPSGGVRWVLYDATSGSFIDSDSVSGIRFYYPYYYLFNGQSATPYVNGQGDVLRYITVKPRHKVYVIRCDNDLNSSLTNQIRAYGSSDYDSLFEWLRFSTSSTGRLKIGGNISSIFFPYTSQVGSYSNYPDYGDSVRFGNALLTSIMGGSGPLHWNFGILKEMPPTNSWIGVTFNGSSVSEINDPIRHANRTDVSGGTQSQIRLNFRNYNNLFAGLRTVLVDASEIEFPVLYNTDSGDIYTQNQTNYSIILSGMFGSCSKLAEAPREIPYIQSNSTTATYYQMFAGCTSLTVSPLIYMHKDYNASFGNMFAGCPLTTLIFRTSTVQGGSGNEIGNLFGTNGLSGASSRLTIYKLSKVSYNGSASNFNGFCGHSGTITVKDIFTDREAFSNTYQHYKY